MLQNGLGRVFYKISLVRKSQGVEYRGLQDDGSYK